MEVVRRAPSDRASIGGVEYMVLGSLRAVQGGVARALGGHRQRIVLAILLANVNRVVSQDALIEAVWSGEPPDAAKATVQSYVSLLRKELGGEILREGDGYRVVVAADQLDASRFERLVAEGRAKLDTDPAIVASAPEEDPSFVVHDGDASCRHRLGWCRMLGVHVLIYCGTRSAARA